ncbi:MAG: AmmeMemoRadiSam system protein B [Acidobacteria bacterium]|nr:AmmeMemoRadiSam system protein B [Acidobacteriota bacterium]
MAQSDYPDLPPMRMDIQMIPASYQGQTVFVIQDPLGFAPHGAALTQQSIGLLMVLSQSESFLEFQSALTRLQNGVIVSRWEAEKVVEQFDQLFLLETDRYRHARQRLVEEFGRQRSRPPALAGQAYPGEADTLREFLDGMAPPLDIRDRIPPGRAVKAIIAPHIDFLAGRRVYAAAYAAWPEAAPQRILLLGTGHQLGEWFFSLTEKDYETPLGTLPTAADTVARLREAAGECAAPDDFAHRSEHSLEFQSLFIRRRLGDAPVRCVPVLCGSFDGLLEQVARPRDEAGLVPVLDALAEVARDPGTLVIAGVDLCHVGLKFGDREPAREREAEARAHDRRLLDALVAGDIAAFWGEARAAEDRYHVCGLSSLATLLEILGPVQGTVLDYEFWHEDLTQSAVSFAAAVLWSADEPSEKQE